MPIALPPRVEQKAIAYFLDHETAKIDALIAEQEKLLALLTEKRQATISHAVTRGLDPSAPMKDSDISWLGEVPVHWEVRRLRFVADISTGDADTADAAEDGRYPFFVRSPNVERIDRYTHDCEAVLTAGDGAGVGKVFHHFDGKFCAHQRVYVFTNFRDVSGGWFFSYLKALFYRVVLEGTAKSTVDSLRRPMIADFPITIPTTSEMAAIEAHIQEQTTKFDRLISAAEAAVRLLEQRRSALIAAAVTGQVDVRGAVEREAA
jgi:type I restriction enzyme S subunit